MSTLKVQYDYFGMGDIHLCGNVQTTFLEG